MIDNPSVFKVSEKHKVEECVGILIAISESTRQKSIADLIDSFLAENFSYEASGIRNTIKKKCREFPPIEKDLV